MLCDEWRCIDWWRSVGCEWEYCISSAALLSNSIDQRLKSLSDAASSPDIGFILFDEFLRCPCIGICSRYRISSHRVYCWCQVFIDNASSRAELLYVQHKRNMADISYGPILRT